MVLADGQTVTADLQYFRNSIRNPDDQVVAGYQAVMPPFPQISEEEILLIMAYLESEPTGLRGGQSGQESEPQEAAGQDRQAPEQPPNNQGGEGQTRDRQQQQQADQPPE